MEKLSIEKPIPHAEVPYPDGIWSRTKYHAWQFAAPHFQAIRNWLLTVGAISHTGRQHFLFGKLAETEKFEDFLVYVQQCGFGNHFVAWHDDGQIASLRRHDGFDRQYHIRIFEDGEIRGHYEYTPEAHPVWHMKETGIEERRDIFLGILGTWITPQID